MFLFRHQFYPFNKDFKSSFKNVLYNQSELSQKMSIKYWSPILNNRQGFKRILSISVNLVSSTESKAQVSFSDQNLSVFCRQPNFAQCILGWRGFIFVQMKGLALFQEELKIHWPNKKIFLQNQFQLNFAQCILGWRGFKLFKWRAPSFSKGR